MKIAFDEHIPAGMSRVFESLLAERKMRILVGASGRGSRGGYVVMRSKDYNPKPNDLDFIRGSDVAWIERFAADGGKVIISGNVKMMDVPQEALALQRTGMITFFFERGWNNGDFFKKSSVLLWHWPAVIQAAKSASKGDIFRIPFGFGAKDTVTLVCRDGQLRFLSDVPNNITSQARKARKRFTQARLDAEPRQTTLPLQTKI